MNAKEQIKSYIAGQPEPKRSDMQTLHERASVTGYCIKFKALKDIDVDVLEAAIRYGVEASA